MENLRTKTIREIALEAPLATRVFEEYKIDYCCGGRKNFLDACRSAGISPDLVERQINEAVETSAAPGTENLKNLSLTELIKYICDKHHTFTRDEIVNLTPLMAKVAARHGENHPELLELDALFNDLCNDLSEHLLKEERVLFPYVEQLERTIINKAGVPMSCFGTVQNPVRQMMSEHDTAGDILRKMRDLTNDYSLPEGACTSYSTLFSRLEGFERDLHQHIHLENNLLFPKAVELEDRVMAGDQGRGTRDEGQVTSDKPQVTSNEEQVIRDK